MIDVEKQIFNAVSQRIKAEYPDCYVTGEFVRSPESFPAVSILEASNTTHVASQTSSYGENHVDVMYEVNVYSNKSSGKKSECRSIARCADDAFAKLGFSRTFMNSIPNMDDATIFRIVSRYKATIGQDQVIYRR